jgi:hypothetical protein
MMARTSLGRVLILAAAGVAAACSSSTAPSAPTAAQTAEHIDAIYSSLMAAGTSSDTEFAQLIAEYVESSPANGATQSTFNITTASGTQSWQGFSIESNDNNDTIFATAVFPAGGNLTNMFISLAAYDASGPEGTLAALVYDSAGTYEVQDAEAMLANAVTSVGAVCSLQTGLAADSLIESFTQAATSCNLITATFSASASFTASSALPAGETSISISNVSLRGIQLGGILIEPDRAPRGPTIAAARIHALMNMIKRRGTM